MYARDAVSDGEDLQLYQTLAEGDQVPSSGLCSKSHVRGLKRQVANQESGVRIWELRVAMLPEPGGQTGCQDQLGVRPAHAHTSKSSVE